MGGGGNLEQHVFFSLVFPLSEYFFVKMLCTNIFFLRETLNEKNIISQKHNLNIGYLGTYAKVN